MRSALLKKTGYENKKLMHITDWYPTLMNLAGLDPYEDRTLNGYNMWDAIRFDFCVFLFLILSSYIDATTLLSDPMQAASPPTPGAASVLRTETFIFFILFI